jgi:hypothetical protein
MDMNEQQLSGKRSGWKKFMNDLEIIRGIRNEFI